ncbi:MAG: CHAT domain-containing protein [Methanothrix sp.]|nr:CHAT domain-containing protein [Methanothrix sp.]
MGNTSPDCYKYFAYTIEKLYGVEEAIRRLSLVSHEQSSNPLIWYSLGLSYWLKQDYTQAIRAFSEAVDRDPTQQSFRFSKFAVMALAGRLNDPVRIFGRLLDEAEQSSNVFEIQFLRSYMLMFLSASGDEKSWRSLAVKSEFQAREFGLARWRGWIHARLSEDALQHGNLGKALSEANLAILNSKLSRVADFGYSASRTAFDVFMLKGEYGKALGVIDKLFEMTTGDNQGLDTGRVFIEAGSLLKEINRPEMALDLIVDGIERTNRAKIDPAALFFADINLGMIYENLHDSVSALRTFQRALADHANAGFSIRDIPVAAGDLARQYLKSGELRKARKLIHLEDSLAGISDFRIEQANTLLNRADLCRRERSFSKALSFLDQCLVLATKAGLIMVQAEAREKIAEILQSMGKYHESCLSYKEVAKCFDSLMCKTPPFINGVDDREAEVCQALVDNAVREKDSNAVVSWFDKSRYSTLNRIRSLSLLSLDAVGRRNELVRGAIGKISASFRRHSLADLASPENKTRRIVEFLKNARLLSDYWIRENCGAKLLVANQTTSIGDIRASLAQDQVVLAYTSTGEHIDIICITADTVLLEHIPCKSATVHQLISALRSNSEYRPSTSVRGLLASVQGDIFPSRALYKMLIEPCSNIATKKFRWIIVPDGEFSRLPFETLKDSTGRYLIESHSVSYRLLLKDCAAKSGNDLSEVHDMLFVGNDDDETLNSLVFDGRYLSLPGSTPRRTLPGIDQECAYIRLGLGESIDVLTGGESTRSKILSMAPNYDIVHIASHGNVNFEDPLISSLNVAPESPIGDVDRLGLSALDIACQRWRASLVFLSSCGTADGLKGRGPGGFIGAFHSAGATAIVASLGELDDGGSARFVGEFYSGLTQGLPLEEALRNAKIKLIRAGERTSAWSPLVLYGSGRGFPGKLSRQQAGEWDMLSIACLTAYSLI